MYNFYSDYDLFTNQNTADLLQKKERKTMFSSKIREGQSETPYKSNFHLGCDLQSIFNVKTYFAFFFE